jgi:GTP-binding protein Era
MNAAVSEAARDADAIVLVSDVGRHVSGSAGAWSKPGVHVSGSAEADLAIASELPSRPIVLALTKVDRIRDKGLLLPLLAEIAARTEFVAAVPLSARRRDGLDRLLDELLPLLPIQPMLFEPDSLSDQPQRFFVAELVREQVIRNTRQEVPHGVTVVVERFDESVKPLRIEASVVVSREAHTRILVGAGGRMVKTIGIAARERIEHLLGASVHLELRVRASPGWPDDQKQLRELGFARTEGEQ